MDLPPLGSSPSAPTAPTAAFRPAAGTSASNISHYDVGVSTISDNYITEVIETFHETHLPYILQWSEQNIVLDIAAGDHHGKRFARTQFKGAELLKWRWTVFNSIGQSAVVANVESCSMYDTGLLQAHRQHRRAAAFWQHTRPQMATCDNPAKDGKGLIAAIWAGDGKPEWLYPGKIIVVQTEEQCDEACAYLAPLALLGFDAENVAYVEGGGVNSDKAAIVQLVGDEHKCFVFQVRSAPCLPPPCLLTFLLSCLAYFLPRPRCMHGRRSSPPSLRCSPTVACGWSLWAWVATWLV